MEGGRLGPGGTCANLDDRQSINTTTLKGTLAANINTSDAQTLAQQFHILMSTLENTWHVGMQGDSGILIM